MDSLVIKLIIVFILFIISLIIYIITKGYIREKRFINFSLSKDDLNEISLFDQIQIKYWKVVHSLSKSLGHNPILRELATDYNKFITINEKNYKKSIDYIAIKLLSTILGIVLIIVLMISSIIPNNLIILCLFIIIGYVLPDLLWNINYFKKCQSIRSKLYQSIIIINDALVNNDIEYAINKVIDELDGPIQDEYKKVLVDISYGVSLVDAFKRFYKRTNIKSIKLIYNALIINSKNLYDTFNLIREEFDYVNNKNNITLNLNKIIDIMSYVYALVPIVFTIMLLIINVDYFKIIKT